MVRGAYLSTSIRFPDTHIHTKTTRIYTDKFDKIITTHSTQSNCSVFGGEENPFKRLVIPKLRYKSLDTKNHRKAFHFFIMTITLIWELHILEC